MKNSKKLWILGIILILFNLIFFWFKFGGDIVLQYVSDLLPVAFSLIAVIALFIVYKSFKIFDFTKIAWLLLFIGIFLFFLGESLYAVLEIIFKLDMNEDFPTIADIFWCAGYIPQFASLAMMFIGYKKSGLPMGKVKNYIFLSIIFIILSASIIYYLLIPIIIDPESDLLTKIFSMFYPIADLFLVAPALILIYITNIFGKGKLSRPWKYISLGFIFFTIADLLYSYLSWLDLYGNGNFIDVAWNTGYLLIGLSAIYQNELLESINTGVDQ